MIDSASRPAGLVTQKLLDLIRAQLQQRHVVVWFDPEQVYAGALERVRSDLGVSVFVYQPARGFLALRQEMEPLWSVWGQEQPPEILIYAPLQERDTQHALVEYTAVGAILAPGYSPPECNTRLAAVARAALSAVFPAAFVDKVAGDVEAGRLSLADLDAIAEKGADVQTGALAIIFGTGNAETIALRFLSDKTVDEALQERGAGPALAGLLAEAVELPAGAEELAALRARLARHLLVAEFLESLQGPVPERLAVLPRPQGRAARDAAVRIVREWRLRRDLAASYAKHARDVEGQLGLGEIGWSLETLQASETFARTEAALQTLAEQELVRRDGQNPLHLIKERVLGYWSAQQPESKVRWQVISAAGEVLFLAGQLMQDLKGRPASAEVLVRQYAEGDTPWCRLDTAYRHLERDFRGLDLDETAHDALTQLVTLAQQRYHDAVEALATHFVHVYQAGQFSSGALLAQADIFKTRVASALPSGPVAYILVDGFRFEMARELHEQLGGDFECTLQPALATSPTITEVGMGALTPGAEHGLALAPAGAGKLGLVVAGVTLKNRADRVKHFEKTVPGAVVTELARLTPLSNRKLQARMREAPLIVVTATDEIDGLWEHDPDMARSRQDEVFNQLRRGVRTLFGLGVSRIVITADHGCLFGSQIITGEPMEAPGGDTLDLHRRVWIGRGGAALTSCLRVPVAAFGLGGDMELVTPYGLGCFRVPGGSMEYFHGGLSLQELVIPVMTVTPGAGAAGAAAPAFTWKVTLGAKKITNRFFSATVEGEARGLFPAAPRVRLELRVGDQVVSTPVTAGYGYQEATRDVVLELDLEDRKRVLPDAVTLQVIEAVPGNAVLHLLDAETGASLHQVRDIPVDIAF